MSEIELEKVSKTFKTKDGTVEALKQVSLSVEAGDIYGIIGMSGAGKSTLVRCMNFLEKPTEGSVKIKGRSLDTLSERELRKQREKIGMIFQQFNLLMQKSVLENICFPLYIKGQKKSTAHKRAKELLELVGLSEKAKAYPAQLSGGQKQRVAIARALASDPEILLCDEATSALDPQTTSSILQLLKEINERFGITIVIITHQMAVVREVCSHVAIMRAGEVVETGSVEEVFTHPKSETAKELLTKDAGSETDERLLKTEKRIQHGEVIRIIFSENSAFEPVISNLVLTFGEPVNVLKAATKNVSGIAKGEMLLSFKKDSQQKEAMKDYIRSCGVEIEEVTADVDA
ncbi:MAG: methionine ABC transporter ATP-binding protein [Lachnospiraceae bacterium]